MTFGRSHPAACTVLVAQAFIFLMKGGYGLVQPRLVRHEALIKTSPLDGRFVMSGYPKGVESKFTLVGLSSGPVDGDSEGEEGAMDAASSTTKEFSMSTLAEDISSRIPENLGDSFSSVASNVMEGEVGSRGEVYFAVQAAAALVLLLGDGVVPAVLSAPLKILFGPVCLLGGLAVVALSILELGDMLSPWPAVVKSSSTGLVKSGPYAQVRHPIYAGAVLAAVGFAVASDSAFRLLLSLILWYVYEVKIVYEEEQLAEAFGADYEAYKKDVPDKLVPRQLLSQYLPAWSIVD